MSKDNNLHIRNSTAEFLIFSKQAGENSIEVRVEDETVWLTQKLIGVLFEVDVRTINEHLGNIYQNVELHREATIRKFRIVQTEGNREVARNPLLKVNLKNTGSYRIGCLNRTLTNRSSDCLKGIEGRVKPPTECIHGRFPLPLPPPARGGVNVL